MYTLSEINIPDYQTMCIEQTITDLTKIPDTFNRLQAFAKEKNIVPKGYFLKYLDASETDTTNMDAQFCLVVDEVVTAQDDIKPLALKGYKATFLKSDSIAFEDLGKTYEDMYRHILEKGYNIPKAPMWELYNKDHTAYILWPVNE